MSSPFLQRPASRSWLEIDPAALQHNLDIVHGLVQREGGEKIATTGVVKANAYGHGIELVVPALLGRVEWFGVANVVEAEEVRHFCEKAGNNSPLSSPYPSSPRILILGPALPDEMEAIVAAGFTPVASTLAEAGAYSALAVKQEVVFPLHLAVDTGMGRIGVWHEEALALAQAITALPGIVLEGVGTHLPLADEDRSWTERELADWRTFVALLAHHGITPRFVHALNSAGTIGYSVAENGNLVRPGLMLYGSSPFPEFQPQLRPVATWKTRLTLVRDVPAGRGISYGRTFITPRAMRVATLGTGYGDGYFRQLSGTGVEVLVGGKRCPLLGRVTMDQILVDISAVPDATVGDEAVLLGRQGGEEILAEELAHKARTIPWHIFTAITARVARRLRSE